jgi:Icc-related predicted phosphoesterase
MIRIVCISDSHTKHHEIEMPPGDLLLVAGDFTGRGMVREIEDFDSWLGQQDYPVRIVVAGNHDELFEAKPRAARELLKHAKYLEDTEITLRPSQFGQQGDWEITVYGTPWQPRFYDWAFNLDRGGNELRGKWRKIPTHVDILVTHGPPSGVMDKDYRGDRAGCELLRDELERIRPRLHVFGHLHSIQGIVRGKDWEGNPGRPGTVYVNASMCNDSYEINREPIVLQYDPVAESLTWE